MNTVTKLGGLAFTVFTVLLLSLSSTNHAVGYPQTKPTLIDASPTAAEPVILTEDQGKYHLGLHLEILEDPIGKLTIADVSSPAYDSHFSPSRVEVPNYGYTESVYWVRIRLKNETRQTNEWILDDGFANTQYVDLYTPSPDGKSLVVKQTGLLRPVATRDFLYPRIVFRLALPPQSSQTIYLRFQSGASMTIPLTLWTMDAFMTFSQQEILFYGLLFGSLFILLAYHIFLLFSLREATYLYFVTLLAGLLGTLLVYDGFMGAYLFPNLYSLSLYFFPLTYTVLYTSMVLFSDAFLDIKSRHPRLHWLNLGYVAIWGILLVLTPFVSYHFYAEWMTNWATLSPVLILINGIVSWRKNTRQTLLFMIAWLVMIGSLLTLELVREGVIPSTMLTENIYQPAFILMAVCWSIAQADRINLLKAGTEEANRNLHLSEQRLTQILEGMPLGVVVYGNDQRLQYSNQRTSEILSDASSGIRLDVKAGQMLGQGIDSLSLKKAGTGIPYPLEYHPVHRALKGAPASADDLEIDIGDRSIPIEVWASPAFDSHGQVETVVAAFQDITLRRLAEVELEQYRTLLEDLVDDRTVELNAANDQLRLHLEWLGAVNEVNQTIARSTEFTQIYEKIVEIINRLFASRDAFIAEFQGDHQQLKIVAHTCQSDGHADLIGSLTNVPESVLSPGTFQQEALSVMPLEAIRGMDGPFGEHLRDSQPVCLVSLPLCVRDQIVGLLGLELSEDDRGITEAEHNLLNIFATDIAQIIETARLFEQAKLLIAAEERNRLARELHDSVAQTMYGIHLYAEAIEKGLQSGRHAAVQENIGELRQLVRQVLTDLRLLIFHLRPSVLEEEGLLGAIKSRLDTVELKSGIKADLETEGEFELTPEQEGELYRIAQEALNNALRHAQAHEIKVVLRGADGQLSMSIEDDGIGFDPESASEGGGQGLRNIRERAEKLGATCIIASTLGQGSKILIEM